MIEAAILLAQENGSGASDIQVAVIGLVGALVGGAITGVVTLWAERRRHQFAREQEQRHWAREDDQLRAVARGTARVMRAEFRRIRELLGIEQTSKMLWHNPEDLVLRETDPDDRKKVAEVLNVEHWNSVERGEMIARMTMARSRQWTAESTDLSMTVEQLDVVSKALAFIDSAVEALNELSDMGAPGQMRQRLPRDMWDL